MRASPYLEYGPLVELLRRRGWDVPAHEEILGRRDDRLGVWTIAIDHGGRVRFSAMRPLALPGGRRLQRDCRRYRLLIEEHATLTVTARLETVDDLPPVLDQLAAFANSRETWSGRQDSGNSGPHTSHTAPDS